MSTWVSTHSHPKVAGFAQEIAALRVAVSTHSHPKVAGRRRLAVCSLVCVSTHSHPKVAGFIMRPPPAVPSFQHTATQRWLERELLYRAGW